jgi:hypothetical protein
MSDLEQYLDELEGGEGFFPSENGEDDGGDEYGLVPVGWYPVEITGSKVEETKSKTGVMLTVEFTVLPGSYAKRKVWNRFNFINQNPKAQAIGKRELEKLLRACGFDPKGNLFTDENQLLGKELDIRVKIQAGENGYKDSNVACDFARLGDGVGSDEKQPEQKREAPAQRTPPGEVRAPQSDSGTTKKRPWERG